MNYSHERFNALIDSTVAELRKLSELKGGEYAGDSDRLANFRRNGANLGVPMELVWAVYAGKHWDAIQQYVQDLNTGKQRERLEGIEGRVDDLIVYLMLFKAMTDERSGEPAKSHEWRDWVQGRSFAPLGWVDIETLDGQVTIAVDAGRVDWSKVKRYRHA